MLTRPDSVARPRLVTVLFLGLLCWGSSLTSAKDGPREASPRQNEASRKPVFQPRQLLAQKTRPNIILIMADDMGFSDLGCYGGEIQTPHIDTLARQGLRWSQFYNNAICGPTRASLLTGLYCQQVGHPGNRWNEPKDFSKCITIGEALQRAGYHTMMVGKWQGRDLAVERGFDRFFGPNCQSKISYYHEVQKNPFYLNNKRWTFPEQGFFLTEALTDYAVQFLDEAAAQTKPFFLYVAYIAPHWPLHAREEEIAPYREQYRKHGWDFWRQHRFEQQQKTGLLPDNWTLAPLPQGVHAWKDDRYQQWQAERMAAYAAQVTGVDRGVGRLMEALQRHKIEQNTLVMFLSDNGAAPDGGLLPSQGGFGFQPNRKNNTWYLNGLAIRPGSGPSNLPGPPETFAAYGLAWASLSNTPLRGTKLTAWEGGIRTPLVVRWPAVIKTGGHITQQFGHVIDFLPTCLDVAGGTYPRTLGERRPLPLEGKSLVPIFHGEQRTAHEQLCWSTPRNQAIRMGRWKLVNQRHGQDWELYDLETDGTETTNLAEKYPERVQQMARRFEEWRKRVGAR